MATDPMLDPDYKYSINKFTGNGAQTSWNLNFSGGYIRREHVKAYTQAADGQITELSFTWSGPNTIVISPPVAMGVRLYVYRDTPKSGPLVDFTDGAIINEYDLDMLARQTVFATAEMVDRFADVAVQSEATTLVAQDALLRAADAQNKVALANSTSSSALLAAQGAVSTASAAVATANTARDTANAARDTANAASGRADTAISTANAAKVTADSAIAQAGSAAQVAAQANINSTGAIGTSNQALGRAINAQEVAGAATVTATAAKTTAETTASQFEGLRDTVEEIAGGDLSNFVRVTQENTFVEKQTFSAGAVIGGVQWGGSGANAKIINAWGDLTGKPTSFPPSAHTHAITDITSLQTTLDAKASNSALTTGLAAKADLAGAVFTGPLVRGTWASGGFSRLNPEALLIRNPGQIDIELSHGQGGEAPAFIRYTTSNILTINAPEPIQSNGKVILTGPSVDDAVLRSTTNLGRTGGGPLQSLTNADMTAAPTGFNTMTGPGSATPNGTYGYFFKLARRDNGGGWSGLWTSHQENGFSRVYLGGTASSGVAPEWTELARLGAPGKPINQNHYGVTAFVNDGAPAAEFWTGNGDGVRFGPKGGISFAEGGSWLASDPYLNFKNFTLRNRDESFRDITATRGDGTGVIYLGGGAYLYHDGLQYHLSGEKDLNTSGLIRAGKRVTSYGRYVPQTYISAGDPGNVNGQAQDGDIWIIP